MAAPINHVRFSLKSVEDLDRPLFRIFPLWFFEHALRVNGGCLALVPPHAWEDPFEDVARHLQMSKRGSQKPLQDYLRPVYAQCWSFEGESDSLLRAYSRVTRDSATHRNVEPKYEGVQVRTTLRKLAGALERFAGKRDPPLKFFVGAVNYVDSPPQEVFNRLNAAGPAAMGDGDNRLLSLLLKRRAFRHEAELRILMLAPWDANWPYFIVDIDPNVVFDEVRFDPRLAQFEKIERERLARDLGYKGPILGNDALYGQTVFLVQMKNLDDGEWPPSAAPA